MLTSTTIHIRQMLVADIHEIRRKNFKSLVAQWDGPTNLAKQLGYTGPSYVSQMVSGNRPITEKTARQIEGKLDLPAGWLDREHPTAKAARPAAVDTAQISQIISVVTTTLEESGVRLAPAKFAELVAMVYEDAADRGHVDEKFINRVIGLLK